MNGLLTRQRKTPVPEESTVETSTDLAVAGPRRITTRGGIRFVG